MNGIITALIMIASLQARTGIDNPESRSFQIIMHDINQVEICISNFGKFGQTQDGQAGLWWPKGSGQAYLFGAGFWFGTVDSVTSDTLVTIGYGPHGGESELGPGLEGMSTADTNARIFMFPDDWPPPQGVFPMAPLTQLSHQDSWCCMNDCDSALHMPGDTRPIGFEVHQTVYVWNLPSIDDIVFMQYQIKNISGHNLYDCYFGVCADCDNSYYNWLSVILNRPYLINGQWYIVDNLSYLWQEETETGTIGFDMLQTPFDLVPDQDKDSDGIFDQYEQDSAYYVNNLPLYMWDVDMDNTPDWRDASENPQLGMTAFKIFTLNLDPNKDHERYLTLAGYNFRTGQYEPFDTILPPTPDDHRFLMSSGPFDLETDGSVAMAFAIVLANWHDIYGMPDTALALVDYWAQHVYDHSWRIFDVKEQTANNNMNIAFQISPNPANLTSTVRFTLAQSGQTSLKLYDATGQLIKIIDTRFRQLGTHDVRMNLNDLSAGTYFLLLATNSGRESKTLIIVK